MNGKPDKYRILLLGDYSNMHSQLGRTLAARGHDVTVMSSGSGFQQTARDIDITRRAGKLGGALLTARLMGPLHKHMRGYDIVALQNPHFLSLKPKRLRYFFDRLCGENASVFLTAAGTDEVYVREALDPDSVLRYNEYRIGNAAAPYTVEHPERLEAWQSPEMVEFCDHVYDRVDGVVTALYEYHVAVKGRIGEGRVAYGGIPIDTKAITPATMNTDGPVRLFLGRHRGRYAEKGTDLLETAARRVVERHPGRVELSIIENRPYAEYINTKLGSHIVLDQIYSYTPATNALLAMARGLCTVSGGEDEFYDFIGERENRPVINALPHVDLLTEILDESVREPSDLARRGADGRRFVEKHNAANVVADRFLAFWGKKLAEK